MTSNALKRQRVGKRNPADLIPPFKDIAEDRDATLAAAAVSAVAGHTAAPWHLAHENAGNGFSIRDSKGRTIGHSAAARSRDGQTLPEADRVEGPEAKANGRVMVASPKLFAAAVEALRVLSDDTDATPRATARQMLREAIEYALTAKVEDAR